MATHSFSPLEVDQYSSDFDDFYDAKESITPRSHTSIQFCEMTPSHKMNPIIVEPAPFEILGDLDLGRSIEQEEEDAIPAPQTANSRGEKYEWASLDSAYAALQEFAKENGFAVKKSTSKRQRDGRLLWQLIRCVHGGQKNTTKVTTPNRKRQSSSLIGDKPCDFRVYLKALVETDTWILNLRQTKHNHSRQDRKSVYAVHRRNALRANPTIIQQINADADALIEPKKSWRSIKLTNPLVEVTMKDIENQRLGHKGSINEGLPAIQAMIQGLGAKFAHQEVIDDDNHLVHLLLFHHTSLQLLLRWPHSLIIDNTYKTNRHDLYLCQIIGKTARNISFIIGQAFLSNESKESFIFILKWLRNFYLDMHMEMPSISATDASKALIAAIKEVWPGLPHILCLWHLYKDVESHCKPLWRRSIDSTPNDLTAEQRRSYIDTKWSDLLRDFQGVIQAPSIIEFNAKWSALAIKWTVCEPEVVAYLRNTWISQKERICTAWTSQYMHFGTTTSSAAESMHRAIKADLPHRHLHLSDAVRVICAYIERVNDQTEHQLATERVRGSEIHYKIDVFRGLPRLISQFALNKVLDHVRSIKERPTGRIGCCTNRFTRQWGLPCAHLFYERQSLGQSLSIEDFHVQWRLDRRE